jgi:hypothetical protein
MSNAALRVVIVLALSLFFALDTLPDLLRVAAIRTAS